MVNRAFDEMNSKILVALFALSICSIPLKTVVGIPSVLNDYESSEIAVNRTKRDLIASAAVAIIYGVGLASLSIANADKCSVTAGCFKGRCWAWCGVSLSSGEWCYTTRTYSQSYEYVPCDSDEECNKCWKCAGPCTL